MAAPPSLGAFIAQLKQVPTLPLPEAEEWKDHVERISVPGRNTEVTEEHYYYWLEALPPRWMDGSHFCFAEGAEPFRLFWRNRDQRYWNRQLTWEETVTFCRLAQIAQPY